jgi:hypothetical protein
MVVDGEDEFPYNSLPLGYEKLCVVLTYCLLSDYPIRPCILPRPRKNKGVNG